MTTEAKIGIPGFTLNQAKYCSVCGNERDKCECQDQAITISISLDKSLAGTLASLINLIPKVQISSNRCTHCGHTSDKCTCS